MTLKFNCKTTIFRCTISRYFSTLFGYYLAMLTLRDLVLGNIRKRFLLNYYWTQVEYTELNFVI